MARKNEAEMSREMREEINELVSELLVMFPRKKEAILKAIDVEEEYQPSKCKYHPGPSRWLIGYINGNPPQNTLAFFNKLSEIDKEYVRHSYRSRGIEIPLEME